MHQQIGNAPPQRVNDYKNNGPKNQGQEKKDDTIHIFVFRVQIIVDDCRFPIKDIDFK